MNYRRLNGNFLLIPFIIYGVLHFPFSTDLCAITHVYQPSFLRGNVSRTGSPLNYYVHIIGQTQVFNVKYYFQNHSN